MISNPPLLSIVIPVFNAESTILRAFNSIYSQIDSSLESDIEIIFIDDASIDSSSEIIKKLISLQERIVLISHVNNKGVSAARFSGAINATGVFIKFMDADDYMPNGSLLKLIEQLRSSDYLLYLGKSLIEMNGSIQSADGIYNLPLNSIVNGFVNEIYLVCQATQMGLWVINRDFLLKNITFDIGNSLGEEFDFCLQIVKKHICIKFLNINLVCIVNSNSPARLSRSTDPQRHWVQFDRINSCSEFIKKNYGFESNQAFELFAKHAWIRGRDSIRLGLSPLGLRYFELAYCIKQDFKPYGSRIYKIFSFLFGPIYTEYFFILLKKIKS